MAAGCAVEDECPIWLPWCCLCLVYCCSADHCVAYMSRPMYLCVSLLMFTIAIYCEAVIACSDVLIWSVHIEYPRLPTCE